MQSLDSFPSVTLRWQPEPTSGEHFKEKLQRKGRNCYCWRILHSRVALCRSSATISLISCLKEKSILLLFGYIVYSSSKSRIGSSNRSSNRSRSSSSSSNKISHRWWRPFWITWTATTAGRRLMRGSRLRGGWKWSITTLTRKKPLLRTSVSRCSRLAFQSKLPICLETISRFCYVVHLNHLNQTQSNTGTNLKTSIGFWLGVGFFSESNQTWFSLSIQLWCNFISMSNV